MSDQVHENVNDDNKNITNGKCIPNFFLIQKKSNFIKIKTNSFIVTI